MALPYIPVYYRYQYPINATDPTVVANVAAFLAVPQGFPGPDGLIRIPGYETPFDPSKAATTPFRTSAGTVSAVYGYTPLTAAIAFNSGTSKANPSGVDFQTGPLVMYDTTNQLTLPDGSTHTVSASTLNGTITGVSYTDANGVAQTTANWQWVGLANSGTYAVGGGGKWSQQILTYTGDGTSNRLIATAVDLSAGSRVVWIWPSLTYDATVCTDDMLTQGKTALMSVGTNQTTTGGIMSMVAGGFTVKDDAGQGVHVNTNGATYTAVILSDTSGLKMRTGHYQAHTSPNPTVTLPSGVTPTMLWVFGRVGVAVIQNTDMPIGGSVSLEAEAKSLTNQIVTVVPPSDLGHAGTFTLGTDNNVNDTGTIVRYYYVVFDIVATDPIWQTFSTFKVTGGGGIGVHVTGLGYTPAFAVTRPYVAGAPEAAWRGPIQTGTVSTYCSIANGQIAAGGINAFALGDIAIGSDVAGNGTDVYGFAFGGGTTTVPVTVLPTGTATATPVPNTDGTTLVIETPTSGAIPASNAIIPLFPAGVPQWWCKASLGESIYQVDSPGAGFVACSGPATDDGWFESPIEFGGNTMVVSGGTPADPRLWTNIGVWATAGTAHFGGSPAASCIVDNFTIYPSKGYTVNTTYPPIRIFDGHADRLLCTLPATDSGTVPQAVLSMLAANGVCYLSTFDSGTSSADWRGRVFELDPATGLLTVLGTKFAAGEMPYALAWHMGRLWCGTNNGVGTAGKIYYFRPGIDTAWTQDADVAGSSQGAVDAMVSYLGKLYVGTDRVGTVRGLVIVRDTAGAYTTSDTGAGGTAIVNNGFAAMRVFQGNLYAAYWNNDTPAVVTIRKFDGTSWTTAYSGAGGTLRPINLLFEDSGFLYAIGGGKSLSGVIVSTPDGITWTNLTTTLPDTTHALLPIYGIEPL